MSPAAAHHVTAGLQHDIESPGIRVETEDAATASRRLRISLTDKCNFQCFFCHNEGQQSDSQKEQSLTVADIARVARACRAAGIRSIKLTGGEPLLFRAPDGDIIDLVRAIREQYKRTPLDLSLTTNGWLLKDRAESLRTAGLDRVTVSLHTLDPDTHASNINRSSAAPTRILEGIYAALKSRLYPVKVNTVLFGPGPSSPGNLHEVPHIIDKCRALRVSELRLYPLIRTSNIADFDSRYHYWTSNLMTDILGLLRTDRDMDEYNRIAAVFEDVLTGRYNQIASHSRFTLLVPIGNELSIALNFMPALDRNARCLLCRSTHPCQEGMYAIRMSANAEFRTCLTSPPVVSLATLLRTDVDDHVLTSAVRLARTQFEALFTET